MANMKIIKTLLLMALFLADVNGQMFFPENQYYREVSFVDTLDNINSPLDANYPNALLSNILPPYMKNNRLANGLNNFALNINKAILPEVNNDNIVMSPLSIAGALAFLLLGSVGQTYNEIAEVLGFFNDINGSQSVHREFGMYIDKLTKRGNFERSFGINPNISYGSAVFLQQDFPIRQQYEDFIRNVYRGAVRHVDFRNKPREARDVINSWVSELTKGKIDNILPTAPPPTTHFVLANALYFKAEWEKYFMDELTARSPFILDKRFPQQIIKVDMMANVGMFPFYKNNELISVGIPYKGNSTFLYAIKPVDATRKDIRQIVNELNAESFDEIIRNMKYQSTIITFPKMKLTSSYNLRSALKRMGINSVFSSQKSNLALLSPVQNSKPTLLIQNNRPSFTIQSTYSPFVEGDDFLFNRFGEIDEEKPKNNNCSMLFENKSPDGTVCTLVEVIDGKNVTVIYKQIGDKIGRRVLSGATRKRRQISFEDWNPGLYVDDVLHKVDMDITESGTEAAAATAILITRDGRRPVFAGNEPFFFVIRDEETKIIIFSSFVFKPSPHYM